MYMGISQTDLVCLMAIFYTFRITCVDSGIGGGIYFIICYDLNRTLY